MKRTYSKISFTRADSVFLDSGVYEVDASLKRGLSSNRWDYLSYLDTLRWILSEFDLNSKLYISNYDNRYLNLNEQIEFSINTFKRINSEFKLKDTKYVFTIHTNLTNVEDFERSNIQALTSSYKDLALIAIPGERIR